MHYKITYPCMPWELDYALLSFTQFKKSKYYLNGEDTIEINPSLNLSSYLVNWEKSKISKKLLRHLKHFQTNLYIQSFFVEL